MIKFFSLVILLSVSTVAFARQGQPETVNQFLDAISYGDYNENFQIHRRGDELRLIDKENNVTYGINVSNPNPQRVSDRFLQMLRQSATSGIATFVKSISIADVRPGIREKQIMGTIIIDIDYATQFGQLTMQVQMDAIVTRSTYNTNPFPNIEQKTLLDINTQNARLTRFNTSYASLNKPIGLLVDLGIRIGGMGLRTFDTLSAK